MRPIDGDRLMMHLTDWWYSSFGQAETDESKAIKSVLDKIEQSLGVFAMEQDRWIPVTEKLPERGQVVMWCNENGSVFSSAITYKRGDDWAIGKRHRYKSVLAWKPLPEPYKAEEES